jgi:hypothetical protein
MCTVNGLTGPGTGKDIVLMGLSSSLISVSDADFDDSGRVDGRDFLTWQRGFGGSGGNAAGDANGDNAVNAADFDIWKGQFGNPFPAAAAAAGVPEPGTAALAGLGALALVAARRRS